MNIQAPPRALSTTIVSALTRLHNSHETGAVLLREFTHILHENFAASPVVIFRQAPGLDPTPIIYRGCNEHQAMSLAHQMLQHNLNGSRRRYHCLTEAEEQLILFLGNHSEDLTDKLLALFLRATREGLAKNLRGSRRSSAPATDATITPPPPFTLPGLVYQSETIHQIAEQVYHLRTSDAPILIVGETGTGKELIARAVHQLSQRSLHPFIPFNCAATPRDLLESQLFGHRNGAFTGARKDFPGLIGAAENGTLFLDEIGELARDVQPKLLRFLQDGEIQRLGEIRPSKSNVRVIAATNRDLKAMVEDGEFRADLYYRLNVVQFILPPLRERREDIPLLTEHFLQRYTRLTKKQGITLAPGVMDWLMQYNWPGNARELENEIQRLVALTPAGKPITPAVLSPLLTTAIVSDQLRRIKKEDAQKTLGEILQETEREIVGRTLARHNGNLSRTAVELGVSRNGLRKMIARLELDRHAH